MSKTISATIGIPAHNEEHTLPRLLDSILSQKTEIIKIKRIIVCCDWCTDNTVSVVKKYMKKNSLIELMSDGKKLGQAKRLEQMYKLANTDIFITFDADTKLANPHVVENMGAQFTDKSIGLVGGTDTPFKPVSLFERIAYKAVEIWLSARIQLRNGNNVHCHHGCASAIRVKCAKKIRYPSNPVGNDEYLYFAVKQMGFNFKYMSSAPVFYRLPENVHDYVTQNTRFLNTHKIMESIFGEGIYDGEIIPSSSKYSSILDNFISSPILTGLAVFLQLLIRVSNLIPKQQTSEQVGWLPVTSTKK